VRKRTLRRSFGPAVYSVTGWAGADSRRLLSRPIMLWMIPDFFSAVRGGLTLRSCATRAATGSG
jgi:hypothetical protein